MIGSIVLTAGLAVLARLFFSLGRNYLAARGIGVPIVVSLIDPTTALWALLKNAVVPCLSLLPGDVGRNARLNIFGWQFRAKNSVHERLGEIFVQVTPSYNIVNIADANLVQEVLRRIDDFPKPRQIYERIEVFGPNLDSINGDAWKRHRKLTAPAFNERVSGLVWDEGWRQAGQLLDEVYASPNVPRTVNNATDICKTLALHVLTYAGFGVRNDYGSSSGVTHIPEGHCLAYKDALCTVLANMVLAVVLPRRAMASPLAPKRWRKVGLALQEFKTYMEEMLEQERNAIYFGTAKSHGVQRSESLTGALIRASEEDKIASEKGLSDQEIYGNMFIFNFAGHDTTANTMAYAIALLAIHPDVQDWVREEVTAVCSGNTPPEYDQVFSRLKRVRALMYEVLRLFPPIVYIPKFTTSHPTVLSVGKDNLQRRDLELPPNTYVVLNIMHLHCASKWWGNDCLNFRPSRWLATSDFINASPGRIKSPDEMLIQPATGTFIPWATGPRVCPGMKFAQVEFVSVISSLLSRHRVEAALPPTLQSQMEAAGYGDADVASCARDRLQAAVDNSDVRVTTTMLRPEDVWLRWHEAQ